MSEIDDRLSALGVEKAQQVDQMRLISTCGHTVTADLHKAAATDSTLVLQRLPVFSGTERSAANHVDYGLDICDVRLIGKIRHELASFIVNACAVNNEQCGEFRVLIFFIF